MVKYLRNNNKVITMFDAVRFITTSEHNRFTPDILDGVDDYRIILTHGVIGELLMVLENNYYGLDKSKFIFLCNNIETANYLSTLGLNAHVISEYIFSNDDLYQIKDLPKTYDCIFPGRESKTGGLFLKNYKHDLLRLYKLPDYPFNYATVVDYYNKAKCGLMTTESEGSCLSVGEMLLCGIPVISVEIQDNLPKEVYYPDHSNKKKLIENTYGLILPNTLGGRELWLNEGNSIYCERNDDSIDEAIEKILSGKFDVSWIRNDFLSKLSFHRYQFLFLLKSVLETVDMDIRKVNFNEFINLPYGNSSINTSQWNSIKTHYYKAYSN